MRERLQHLHTLLKVAFGPCVSMMAHPRRENTATDLMATKSPFYRMLHLARTGAIRNQPTQHTTARFECDDSTPETAALTGDAAELGSEQNGGNTTETSGGARDSAP